MRYPTRNGITRTAEGTVASREYEGQTRLLCTKENAVIIAYGPGAPSEQVITLLSRRDAEQTPLEGIDV